MRVVPALMRLTRPFLLSSALLCLFMVLACGLGYAPAGGPPRAEEPASPEDALPAATPILEPSIEEPPEEVPPSTVAVTPLSSIALPSATPPVSKPVPEANVLAPAILEHRRLNLEFPASIRLGDSTRIRMQLEVDDLGNLTPTAIVAGNRIIGETVQIPNLYDTHIVIAEARLDLAGMQVQPSDTISEPLPAGKPVTFYWSVRPDATGEFQGSVWLHLKFQPKAGGEQIRIPVSVQFVDIEVHSLFGFFSGGAARGLGAVGSAIGTVLGFPFLDDFFKWIWGKRRRKP